jgi:hypothetical protein
MAMRFLHEKPYGELCLTKTENLWEGCVFFLSEGHFCFYRLWL